MSDCTIERPKIDTEEELQVEEPSLYAVVFHNDNVTPMDYVTSLISAVFGKSIEESVKLTMRVHTQGTAVIDVFTYDIAETKKNQCDMSSSQFGFSLKVTIEPQE